MFVQVSADTVDLECSLLGLVLLLITSCTFVSFGLGCISFCWLWHWESLDFLLVQGTLLASMRGLSSSSESDSKVDFFLFLSFFFFFIFFFSSLSNCSGFRGVT